MGGSDTLWRDGRDQTSEMWKGESDPSGSHEKWRNGKDKKLHEEMREILQLTERSDTSERWERSDPL
jgi:hypothetical protein